MSRVHAQMETLEERPAKIYTRATILGFVTGIRSMMPLALLTWTGNTSQNATPSPSMLLTTLAALGEVIADKLPITPSRTSPGPFIGRLVIGGLAGIILCRRAHLSPIVGAITGSIGAAIGASVISYSRSWLSKVTRLPSPLWGGLEDILALGLGFFAVRKNNSCASMSKRD